MRLLTIRVPVERHTEPFLIAPLVDTHLGATDADTERLSDWLDKVRAASKTLVFGLGDYADFIARRDKRYRAGSCATDGDNVIWDQIQAAHGMLASVRDRLPIVLEGNHEWTVGNRGEINPIDVLRDLLAGVNEVKTWAPGEDPVVGGMEALVRVIFERDLKKRTVTFYLHHGYFHGKRPNVVRHLENLIRMYRVDVAVVGHNHLPVDTGPIVHQRPDKFWSSLQQRSARGIMCMPWKSGRIHGDTSWEELRGMVPRATGPTLIEVLPATGESQVFFGDAAFRRIEANV